MNFSSSFISGTVTSVTTAKVLVSLMVKTRPSLVKTMSSDDALS